MTDRIARRPHGRRARETYASLTSHDFAWAPVLDALEFTAVPEAKGSPAAPYPLATRGHFHTDDELVAFARAAGFRDARLAAREEWAQLLYAR